LKRLFYFRPAWLSASRVFGALFFVLVLSSCSGSNGERQNSAKTVSLQGSWEKVWQEVKSLRGQEKRIPEEAKVAGPPLQRGESILFRFQAEAEAKNVYVAGNFNGWAHNNQGRITNPRFAMRKTESGVWYREERLHPDEIKYSFVVESAEGDFRWLTDPSVRENDGDGHSIFRLSDQDLKKRTWSGSESARSYPALQSASPPRLCLETTRAWVKPGQAHELRVSAPEGLAGEQAHPLELIFYAPTGEETRRQSLPWNGQTKTFPLPAKTTEGAQRLELIWGDSKNPRAIGEIVLTTVARVVDDLRYGFFTDYRPGSEVDAAGQAGMLARLGVNAVEFYDYFPAHGLYAPTEKEYQYEPFGIPISGEIVRQKIQASQERGILSLAYVAAYATSESVYRKHPHPMTDEKGAPKIFNGDIMTEPEADRQKKPKWFWLMNVADDSPWHAHVLGEFRRALDDSPADLFSFDGFEIDSYGDKPDTRFFAQGSRRNGDLLVDVLHDFVGQVQRLTHQIKPEGLVSFNSVNEFGAELMKDVTDFQFLEIWRFYTDEVEELVEICLRQREPRQQRVILKLYPADMQPKQTSWPAGSLARILGATMTGAGSLMVVGEPDAKNRTMHALNSLFYPDHTAVRSGNHELLAAYYRHDTLLYGYTHGPKVVHVPLDIPFADGLTRTFAAQDRQTVAVQILRLGPDRRWSSPMPWPEPLREARLEIPKIAHAVPSRMLFSSPDATGFANPTPIEWKDQGGKLEVVLPPFCVHASLLLQYGVPQP